MSDSASSPTLTRRRAIALAAAAWLVILGICLLLFTGGGKTFADRFARLREGMTKAEVHALVGPPGNYASPSAKWIGFANVGPIFGPLHAFRSADHWGTDHGDFFVAYDQADRVIAMRSNLCRRPASLWERFSDWAAAMLRPAPATMPAMPPIMPPVTDMPTRPGGEAQRER